MNYVNFPVKMPTVVDFSHRHSRKEILIRRLFLLFQAAVVLVWFISAKNKRGTKFQRKRSPIETSEDKYLEEFLNKTYLRRAIDSFQGGGGDNSSVIFSEPSVQKFIIEAKKNRIYVRDVHNVSMNGISLATFCASNSRASEYVRAWGIPRIECDRLAKKKGWIGAQHFSAQNSGFIIRGKAKNKLEIELKDFGGNAVQASAYPVHVRFAGNKAMFAGCSQPKSNGIIAISPVMTKEVCLDFGLQGEYRVAIRVLRYDTGKYNEHLPCEKIHTPGAGPARFNCEYEDYSINLPLSSHDDGDRYSIRCEDLPSEKESMQCIFGGIWLRNFNWKKDIVSRYPYRWFGEEALKSPWQKLMLTEYAVILKELKFSLTGKVIIFNGSSLVRELYRAFNEILHGSAIPCFFKFGSGAVQSCSITSYGNHFRTLYISRPRPWADNFKDEVLNCESTHLSSQKSKDRQYCRVLKLVKTADIFITSPEGLSGSQTSKLEQADMMKKTSEGLRNVFGSPSQRKVKLFFLETTIAGEGGVATVFQNSARTFAFNTLVQKLALLENAEVIRLFEPSRIILGSSYDNVHMCPQCCNTGIDAIRTESQWNDKELALAEMMGCHMKVDVVIFSLLKTCGDLNTRIK